MPLLTCVCTDPEPTTDTEGWSILPNVKGYSNGWNVVKNFKSIKKVDQTNIKIPPPFQTTFRSMQVRVQMWTATHPLTHPTPIYTSTDIPSTLLQVESGIIDNAAVDEDYIFKVRNKDPHAPGRDARFGELKRLKTKERKFRALLAMSKEDPQQEFVVWWELLKNSAEKTLNKSKQKEDRDNARQEKKKEKDKKEAEKDKKAQEAHSNSTKPSSQPPRERKAPLKFAKKSK